MLSTSFPLPGTWISHGGAIAFPTSVVTLPLTPWHTEEGKTFDCADAFTVPIHHFYLHLHLQMLNPCSGPYHFEPDLIAIIPQLSSLPFIFHSAKVLFLKEKKCSAKNSLSCSESTVAFYFLEESWIIIPCAGVKALYWFWDTHWCWLRSSICKMCIKMPFNWASHWERWHVKIVGRLLII